MKQILIYQTADGQEPYTQWLDALRDKKAASVIEVRINRVRLGNLGNHRSVGEGVIELKINFGPGYRVYLGQHGNSSIIMLCGGDKKTQDKDIVIARSYWKDCKENL